MIGKLTKGCGVADAQDDVISNYEADSERIHDETKLFIYSTIIPIAGLYLFTFHYWYGKHFSTSWFYINQLKTADELIGYIWAIGWILVTLQTAIATYRFGVRALDDCGVYAFYCFVFIGPLIAIWFGIVMFLASREKSKLSGKSAWKRFKEGRELNRLMR